jgi:hypothetical protein
MGDGTGLVEALLGLDGFRVLEVDETPSELVITVETTAEVAGCSTCGVQAHGRLQGDVRDLPCFGRPARLVWTKRRWRCREAECPCHDMDRDSDPGGSAPCGADGPRLHGGDPSCWRARPAALFSVVRTSRRLNARWICRAHSFSFPRSRSDRYVRFSPARSASWPGSPPAGAGRGIL